MKKTISVNGRPMECDDHMTVEEILAQMKFDQRISVVKMNGSIIKKELYAKTLVPEKAQLTIFQLVSGG